MKRLTIFIALLLMSIPVHAADVYVTQSGTGSGASCADARSAAWFNANATGGNTYHLCGTFTGTAGQTMLTVPSGSAGNTLTVLFEDGAVLTAPYWGSSTHGAIDILGTDYITIDGGTNGVIRNTANGTSLANQQASRGIYATSGATNVIIRKLTIEGIYANEGSLATATDTAGVNSSNIRFEGGTYNNILIDNNTLSNSRAGVDIGYSGSVDNVVISNNYINDHCWGIVAATSGGTPTVTNVEMTGNEITDWINWTCPANAVFCNNKTDTYHTDGIITWQTRGGTYSPKIHGNYIHGYLGPGSATGFIFCTYGSGTVGDAISCDIYNNLLINEGGFSTPIWIGGANVNTKIRNNTIVCNQNSPTGAVQVYTTGAGKNITIQNNIIQDGRMAYQTSDGNYVQFGTIDYNHYYLVNRVNDATGESWRGYNLTSDWSTWQGLGFDAHGIKNTNPLFVGGTDYSLQSGSVAIDNGTSLSVYFTTDYAGVSRPQGPAWDIGAYEYDLGQGSVGSFSFTDNTDVAELTVIYSDSITVTGSIASVTPSITGAGCYYQVNGTGSWLLSGDNVVLGDTIALKTLSLAATPSPQQTSCTFTLTGGSSVASDTWYVTTIAVPNIPNIISPVDVFDISRPVTFSWSAVTGAELYEIQIATDSGFTDIVIDVQTINTTYEATTLLPGMRYYWRVRALQ